MGFNGFFYIGSLGHCGTKWLATVLNRPAHGIACYYEMLNQLPNESLTPPTLSGGEQDIFEVENLIHLPYFVFFREMSKLLMVGDAHSWPPHQIGPVLRKLCGQKAIWLVRNGVAQVHSFDIWLSALGNHSAPDHRQFIDMMQDDVEQIGTPVPLSNEWAQLSQFQQLCWWWSINAMVAGIIRTWSGSIYQARFEDVIKGGDELAQLIQWINPLTPINRDELAAWPRARVNQGGVTGDPEKIWKTLWSQGQRAVFNGVCGQAMMAFGYPLWSVG